MYQTPPLVFGVAMKNLIDRALCYALCFFCSLADTFLTKRQTSIGLLQVGFDLSIAMFSLFAPPRVCS